MTATPIDTVPEALDRNCGDQIVDLFRNGVERQDIANQLGCSYEMVKKRIQRAALSTPRPLNCLTPEKAEFAFTMHQAGVSTRVLAGILGCTVNALRISRHRFNKAGYVADPTKFKEALAMFRQAGAVTDGANKPALPEDLALYRHFNDQGDLLYLGKTIRPILDRQNAHAKDKEWWREVVHISVVRGFASEDELAIAEIDAIRAEWPRYNKHYNQQRLAAA